MRFAHVQDEQVVATVLPRLQILRRNFRNTVRHRGSLLTANPAELFIVNQLRDRPIVAAKRASGVFAKLQFPETHAERVEQQQPPDERLSGAEKQTLLI